MSTLAPVVLVDLGPVDPNATVLSDANASKPQLDERVYAAARLPQMGTSYPIQDRDKEISTQVSARAELITDIALVCRMGASVSVNDMTINVHNDAPAAIEALAVTSGLNVLIGHIYKNNATELHKRATKSGNKKGITNASLDWHKGAAMMRYGVVVAAYRGLSLVGAHYSSPGMVTAIGWAEKFFTGTGIMYFAISMFAIANRIRYLFALKWKMWFAPGEKHNHDLAQFAVMAKKMLALPTERSMKKELAALKNGFTEENKADLKDWINVVLNSGIEGESKIILERMLGKLEREELKLRPSVKTSGEVDPNPPFRLDPLDVDEELKSLFAAIRIGSRKQEKLLAHFGGNAAKLNEMRAKVEGLLETLNEKAVDLDFVDFNDLMAHANSKGNIDEHDSVSTKRSIAQHFLSEGINDVVSDENKLTDSIHEVVASMHSTLTRTMALKAAPAVLIYGLGLVLWVLGLIVKEGSKLAIVIPWLWLSIGVLSLILDGYDLYANRNHALTDKEKRLTFAMNCFTVVIGSLAMAMAILSGGTAPVGLAVVLLIAYVVLYAGMYFNERRNNAALAAGYSLLGRVTKEKKA